MVATSGVADLRTHRPLAPNGYFRTASTSKAFVATVILQLEEEGMLSLDDTVERRLPGVVKGHGNDGSAITIRQLLQHTSGIHDDYPDFSSPRDYYEHRYDVYRPEQLVARAMNHRPDFPPGHGWAYSNTGYLLLDMIIERITGNPVHQEITHRILGPLGLAHTRWTGTSPTLPHPHADAYQLFGGGALVNVTEQVLNDAGTSFVSTTADINRFFRSLLAGRLLHPRQLDQMQRTVAVSGAAEAMWPDGRYGLGLVQRPLSCGGIYWSHEGGDGGYVTLNGVTDDGRRSAVVSMSTARADSEAHALEQEDAASALIDHALCPAR
ncbi:serine hydrolase domain-containing protein [Streptomyces sp. S.PNR 29]|uniref:serine hydrolase domain-containing protein n=1 Tax=Streptomyces sp. S.PNR 29 TaxID=2973805 RepID=UPI0025B071A7|nr:serine hydrolase domain-containing protein [Streptomyces sp. S.PNR 29]MDN0196724.1 beta-lactamase family protein [Streptomyces sp. S.PNR 29]